MLQQSGCGKAVASVRKYYFGGQVKHNDKEVASAASTLRARWMGALGKGSPASAPSAPSSASGTPAAGGSSADTKPLAQAPTLSKARSDPAHSSNKNHAPASRAGGDESPRARSPKAELSGGSGAGEGGGGREIKSRENGSRGVGGGGVRVEGGRYGGGREEERVKVEAAVKKEAKKEAKKEVVVPADTVASKISAAVAMNEVRAVSLPCYFSFYEDALTARV